MTDLPDLFHRLRERKVVQYALTYLAAAWLALQLATVVGVHFGWPASTLRVLTVLLAVGFPLALVLAWYHGEKGRQRVSGPELLMVTALLVLAGVAVTVVRGGEPVPGAVAGSRDSGAGPGSPSGELPPRAAARRDPPRAADGGAAGADLSDGPAAADRGADRASVAVLPFDNLTGDPDQEYFSDGMTEEIITHLARLEGLKVISRTSVMRYKDADRTLRQIGDELGVRTVLEGSVRREGRRVRVTAQLVDARTDDHLWAESYDRELESVFEIQADVARAIAGELELRIPGGPGSEAAAVGRYGTDDREALDLYLRARALWNLRTEEKIREAIGLFERAVERDPEFAAAHAGLADALIVLPAYAYSGDAPVERESYERAESAARRALELDPGLAEARAALGMAATYFHRWEAADEEFRRAVEGAPGYATAHQWYAIYLSAVGRMEEAVRRAERARALNPYAVAVTFDLGLVLFMARRYEEALEMMNRARELSPEYESALDLKVVILEELGRYGEAIETLDLFLREAFGDGFAEDVIPGVRAAYRESGGGGYYRARARATGENAPHFLHARYVIRSGDVDRAMDLLESAADAHQFQMIHVGVAPDLDGLRSHPRYRELLERMGLDRYFPGPSGSS
jgi:TolB-like protein/Tfp pilus assembly protein PilF